MEKKERKEQIKEIIIKNADVIAERMATGHDFELKTCKDGVAIYELSKTKLCL